MEAGGLSSGQSIEGRYTVLRLLGAGGMARVYQVRHAELGSLHALKVLRVSSPEIRERLRQEGRVQSRVRHPNIVAVTDVVSVQGAPGLVMEYIGGPSLRDLLDASRLDHRQADGLARGILDGVEAAHRAGLIHRDLKPGNVLLDPVGDRLVPRITDFGSPSSWTPPARR